MMPAHTVARAPRPESRLRNPRTLWATAYILINLVAAGMVLSQGQLLGDLADEALRDMDDFVLTTVSLCLVIALLLVVFNAAVRVDTGLRPLRHDRRKVGLLLAVAQGAFILYVQQTGLFIAGSSERGGSLFSAFWVLFNTDALFIIYYGSCRDSPHFKLNLVLWVISFLQRGWFGYLFFVVALESFRIVRKRQVSAGKIALVVALIAIYPILDLVKVYVRVADVVEPAQAFQFTVNEISSPEFRWMDSFAESAEKIVSRIQVVSHAQAVSDNASYFHRLVENDGMVPFWKEGVLGIIWDKLMGQDHGPEAAQALAAFIAPFLDSSWNVNPSLPGWLTMYEHLLTLAVLYVAGLCALSIVLGSLIDDRPLFRDAVWFVWLTFLVPGWIAQFVSFVLALGVYIALALLSRVSLKRPASAAAHGSSGAPTPSRPLAEPSTLA